MSIFNRVPARPIIYILSSFRRIGQSVRPLSCLRRRRRRRRQPKLNRLSPFSERLKGGKACSSFCRVGKKCLDLAHTMMCLLTKNQITSNQSGRQIKSCSRLHSCSSTGQTAAVATMFMLLPALCLNCECLSMQLFWARLAVREREREKRSAVSFPSQRLPFPLPGKNRPLIGKRDADEQTGKQTHRNTIIGV